MQSIVNAKDLSSINKTLFELACLQRWSEIIVDPGKYSELAKQALNSMITYVWSVEALNEGESIDFTVYPKIIISRALTKCIQCDIPEINLDRIFQLGKVSREDFNKMIFDEYSKQLSENFFNQIKFDDNSIEARIFKASTKLATILELREIKNTISNKDFKKKEKQLMAELKVFSNLQGYEKVNSESYLEVFEDFSQLRNRIRWAKHPNIIKSNVLGHMFDVAIFAYIMSLEVNPDDENLATKYFFMGIFHDFPEKWTGDMPSPIKDSVAGLREATEAFENEVMKENVYSKLPIYQTNYIRDIMLEDEKNIALKKFLKKSDNFSAFIESWRELDSGSHHGYYKDVIVRVYESKEKLPEFFRLLTEKLYGDLFYR